MDATLRRARALARDLRESIRGFWIPSEEDVLNGSEEILGDIVVHGQGAGIHDAHVEPGVDRVIEERRVHRFPHLGRTPERERNVADAA